MDFGLVETKVNDVLTLKVRTPETVVNCVGVEFVEKYAHLTTMLCDPKVDLSRLERMLKSARCVHSGETDSNTASETIGMELAKEYIPAVRDST